MKKIFKVKYRHGLMDETYVTAIDEDEAKREAVATCRFFVGCIPERYRYEDLVESIAPIGENERIDGSTRRYRPTAQVKISNGL